MNHRNSHSRKKMLWLVAAAGLIVLTALLIRPPAWATPLPGVENVALRAEPVQEAAMTVADAPDSQLAPQSNSPAPEFQADTPSSDNCIACHTDKKKLKKLAKEPEEVKSEEASGEG